MIRIFTEDPEIPALPESGALGPPHPFTPHHSPTWLCLSPGSPSPPYETLSVVSTVSFSYKETVETTEDERTRLRKKEPPSSRAVEPCAFRSPLHIHRDDPTRRKAAHKAPRRPSPYPQPRLAVPFPGSPRHSEALSFVSLFPSFKKETGKRTKTGRAAHQNAGNSPADRIA